jgi:photosystem II stability/assembly factor-like uncharacterized protein
VVGRYEDVFFIDADQGWVIYGSEIYRTTDGGASWQTFTHAYGGFRSVVFVDSLRGWIGTLNPMHPLLSTSDGGATVQSVDLPEPRPVGVCGLWAPSHDVIYGSGRYNGWPTVIKSVDAGQTWASIDLSSLATRLIDCYFSHPDSGFVVGGVGPFETSRPLVLSTTDGGASWSVRYLGSGRHVGWCWKIVFPTRSTGYVSVEPEGTLSTGHLLKTVDGGQTWLELPFTLDYQQGIGFATETLGWLGYGGRVSQTSDGGATWVRANFGGDVNSFHMLGPEIGYAAGRLMYKYSRQTPVSAKSMSEVKSLWR